MLVSELITELQKLVKKNGDTDIFIEHESSGVVFTPARIGQYSVNQSTAKIQLREIKPQTQDWIDFCTAVNKGACRNW